VAKKVLRVPASVVKARLNLRIAEDLLDWAKSYARRKETTLTFLITQYLMRLRNTERGRNDGNQF
jgi:hypothetical protein